MDVPEWEPRAGRVLARLQRSILLLAAATPVNLQNELNALETAFKGGRPRAPRFAYTPPPTDVRAVLHGLAGQLEGMPGPLAALYKQRVQELWLEAQLCQTAGAIAFVDWAVKRYQRDDTHEEAANALAARWLSEAADEPSTNAPLSQSDDENDPASLLCRMRQEVGKARIAFRVEPSARLAALAATGPGIVYVTVGKALTAEDVERTVLHEVAGHALPTAAAERSPLSLARIGSAFGSDEQEGRALLLERDAGHLGSRRKAELARRHVAARAAHERADFVDTVRMLLQHQTPLKDALRITARTYRGGGLGRERAYLPAMLRVDAAVKRDPRIANVMASGKWSVAAASRLLSVAPHHITAANIA